MSKEFRWIWKRPLLVDRLLSIWEHRQEQRREMDLVQYQSMHLLDFLATARANEGAKEGQRIKSVRESMFPKESETTDDFEKQKRIAIAAAERERRARKNTACH